MESPPRFGSSPPFILTFFRVDLLVFERHPKNLRNVSISSKNRGCTGPGTLAFSHPAVVSPSTSRFFHEWRVYCVLDAKLGYTTL